jgi:hypothetical protein
MRDKRNGCKWMLSSMRGGLGILEEDEAKEKKCRGGEVAGGRASYSPPPSHGNHSPTLG